MFQIILRHMSEREAPTDYLAGLVTFLDEIWFLQRLQQSIYSLKLEIAHSSQEISKVSTVTQHCVHNNSRTSHEILHEIS